MLVSVASFLPILVVGPIADLLGTTVVLVLVGSLIAASGIASIYLRGPLRAVERDSRANVGGDRDPFVTALGVEARPGDMNPEGEPIAVFGDSDADRAADSGLTLLPAADPVTAAESTPEVTEVIHLPVESVGDDPGEAFDDDDALAGDPVEHPDER
jgi:hypothetical protein